jgi:hypothetical protein
VKNRVAVLDTSLFCCFLGVPGRETAGSGQEAWDRGKVKALVAEKISQGSKIVLPLATIIETGNHIANAPRERYEQAISFCNHLRAAVRGTSPWIAFEEQAFFWTESQLLELADGWPNMAIAQMSLGDATIKQVADYYASANFEVEILTSDRQLRAYHPIRPAKHPRRSR